MVFVTIQPAVKQETKKIAVGVCLLSALMVGVYLIIGRFSAAVLWGTLLGAAFAALNFFLMALSVQQAAEKMNGVQLPPEEEAEAGKESEKTELSPQAKQARRNMQLSYTGRMALLIAMAAIAYFVPGIDPVPALLAQLFPRLTIFIEGILMKKETQAQ